MQMDDNEEYEMIEEEYEEEVEEEQEEGEEEIEEPPMVRRARDDSCIQFRGPI